MSASFIKVDSTSVEYPWVKVYFRGLLKGRTFWEIESLKVSVEEEGVNCEVEDVSSAGRDPLEVYVLMGWDGGLKKYRDKLGWENYLPTNLYKRSC